MHHITDKLHHKKAASPELTPVSPLSAAILPQASLVSQQQSVLLKEYQVSNAQGGYVQAGGIQHTLPLQQTIQQTTFAQVPVTTSVAPILSTQQLAQQQLVQQQLHQEQFAQQQFAQQQFAQRQFTQQQHLLGQQHLTQQHVLLQQQQALAQQHVVLQQQQTLAQNIETVHVHTLPTVVETRVRPAIIEQTTRIDKITEIQPVVHREIEQPRHHILERHIYETVPSVGPSTITNQTIVEEVVRPRVIEQIQPVLHREVPAPFIERVEEHITEHVVAPTQTTKQVLSETKVVAPVQISQQREIGAPIVQRTEVAAVMESRMRGAIVEQTTRAEKITEIQPIIHREIEAPEVHVIEKHMYEQVRSQGPSVVTNQAIVQETVKPHIIEQIQPIVHRSVPAPFVERVEEHINEHVVAPTQTTKQVLSETKMVAPVVISEQREIGAPIIQRSEAAPVLESRTRGAIVEQTTRAEKITEIQPIIHREIEAPEVHVIEKHMYEQVRSQGPSVVTNQAIVQETVKPHIVEQIQPIVHRSVPAPFVEKVEQHINEHVVAPTQTTKQVLEERVMAAPVQISQQREIGAPIVQRTEAAPVMESRTRGAIVEQTARAEKITQIQPIIHREIEAPELHVIEKHMYEQVRSTGPSVVTNQAIVQETVKPHIVEQIQPIVHRSVPAPFVEKVEQHINEHVVAPTQTTKQVLEERVMAAPVQISQQHAIGAPIVQRTEAAPVMESRTRGAIVEQTARAEKITQVQPIIHREIEAPEIHVIEKHMYEQVRSAGPGVVTNQAIVQETVTPHIVEQIQPIVHRSVPAPFVEKVEQHTTEHVVAPTQTTKQVLTERVTAAPVQISQQHEIGAPIIQRTEAAAVLESRTRAALVEQTARPERITQVQPIIHRQIEAPEVHVIEKHSYEQVRSTGPSTITRGAIVEETVIPKVIEEIQPIIHREVPQAFVERVEQHVTEHVVAPTQTTRQIVKEERVGAAVALPTLNAQVSTTPIVHSSTAQTVTESVMRPALVEQTTRAEKITQVQPIIHREIEAPEVHVIEKHLYEKVPSMGPSVVTNQAIVQETVRPHIVEEIQPVVHRNVPVPVVERVEQHVTEHTVLPTVQTTEVLVERNILPSALRSHGVSGVRGAGGVTTTTTTTTTTTQPVVGVISQEEKKHGLKRLF